MSTNDHSLASPEPTAAKLERLITAFIHAYNVRDADFQSTPDVKEALSHIHTADWHAQNGDIIRDWPHQIEEYRRNAQLFPENQLHIVDLSTTVDETTGLAVVFGSLKWTGMGNVTLHSMHEFHWRWVNDAWQFYYTVGLRGNLNNAGL